MIQKEKNLRINVYDDDEMRANGFLRPFNQSPRDESVWTKTPKERRMLKEMKYACRKEDMHFHMAPPKRSTVKAKLIIQLKRNKKFSKTTYSFICLNTAVNEILDKFRTVNPKTGYTTSMIAKYSYNGKQYAPEEYFC